MQSQSDPARLDQLFNELANLRQQVSEQQKEIASLKAVQTQTQPDDKATSPVKASRRRMLRQVAGGLLAGIATAGALGTSQPGTAQAGASFNPNSLYGAIVLPPSGTFTGTLPGAAARVGLYASGDLTLDFSTGVPSSPTGVRGQINSGVGVFGDAETGIGVRGNSNSGNGVLAFSSTGAPFRIQARASAPSGGTRSVGDMYVDNSGNLFVWNGTVWKQVMYV